MSDVTVTQEQYKALITLARQGCTSQDQVRALEVFLKDIDTKNGVTRYALLVQWQELNSPLPPNTRFPEQWPPQMRLVVERTDRPIAKADVTAAVAQRASSPTNIMVTADLGGAVGWTKIEDFFVT